jgi:hypothetical protein
VPKLPAINKSGANETTVERTVANGELIPQTLVRPSDTITQSKLIKGVGITKYRPGGEIDELGGSTRALWEQERDSDTDSEKMRSTQRIYADLF